MFKFFADAVTESIPVIGFQDGARPSPWERPIGPGPRPIDLIKPIVFKPVIGGIKEPGDGKVKNP